LRVLFFFHRYLHKSVLYNLNSSEYFYLIKSPILKFFYKIFHERARYKKFTNERLVYTFHGPLFRKKIKKFNMRFISIRLTRLYFLTFQDYQFRSLLRKAVKLDGNFEVNYMKFLECRLLSIIYRFIIHIIFFGYYVL
jgi:hypothetical protein